MFKPFTAHQLICIYGSYVDDLLRTSNEEFVQLCKRVRQRIVTSEDETLPLTLAGHNISRYDAHLTCIDRSFYEEKRNELSTPQTYAEFRSQLIKLAWLANSRSD